MIQTKWLMLLLLLIMSLLLSSCQVFGAQTGFLPASLKNIGDGGLITGNPCSAPCFWGIRPGLTREAEALKILKERGVYPYCDLINHERESGVRGYDCAHIISINFQFGTDLIDGVGFRPSIAITLEDLISKFGPPDYVLVSSSGTPEENPWIDAAIYYDEIEMSIYLPGFQSNSSINPSPYSIVSSTKIDSIGYSANSDFWHSLNPQRWKGFGEYSLH